jgi:hypothetical protein
MSCASKSCHISFWRTSSFTMTPTIAYKVANWQPCKKDCHSVYLHSSNHRVSGIQFAEHWINEQNTSSNCTSPARIVPPEGSIHHCHAGGEAALPLTPILDTFILQCECIATWVEDALVLLIYSCCFETIEYLPVMKWMRNINPMCVESGVESKSQRPHNFKDYQRHVGVDHGDKSKLHSCSPATLLRNVVVINMN